MMMGVACLCRRALVRRRPYPDSAEVKIRTLTGRGLIHPVQKITHDRPPRPHLLGLVAQNPMAVQPIDGAVAPFQLNPGIDEGFPAVPVLRERVREWHPDDPRLRDDDRELRVEHRQRRAPLGWNQEGVEVGELFHAGANRDDFHPKRRRALAIAVVLDGVYQYLVLRWLYPGEALLSGQDKILDPRGFALIMIGTGLMALMLSAVQHRESLRLLKETYGPLHQSVAGPVAALVALLGEFALIGVSVRV